MTSSTGAAATRAAVSVSGERRGRRLRRHRHGRAPGDRLTRCGSTSQNEVFGSPTELYPRWTACATSTFGAHGGTCRQTDSGRATLDDPPSNMASAPCNRRSHRFGPGQWILHPHRPGGDSRRERGSDQDTDAHRQCSMTAPIRTSRLRQMPLCCAALSGFRAESHYRAVETAGGTWSARRAHRPGIAHRARG